MQLQQTYSRDRTRELQLLVTAVGPHFMAISKFPQGGIPRIRSAAK